MNLTPKGQSYVVFVAAAGLLVLGHCITVLLTTTVDDEWVILAGLTLLSGAFSVKVPGLSARISVSETFVFSSVLLFGACTGTLTVALDVLVVSLVSQRKHGSEPLRVLFNISSASLSIWVASTLFFFLAGIQPLSTEPARVPELLWPLIALTAVHFFLNSGLIAIALAVERKENPFSIWRRIFPWLSINYFGGASVAVLLVSYTRTVDLTALSIIVPLLVISYLTYKMALGRVEDAVAHVDEVNQLYLSTIETLATAIDAKDQVTHGHIRRVQRVALALAERLGVKDPQQLKALEAAALLHDMGKIAVPEHILNKPSRLSAAEFEKMKRHASIGAEILSSIRFPYPVVPIVRHHHENWDGSGYPDGLRGTAIPLGARILSVVDCFDALTSDRPYRTRLSDAAAVGILMERRGKMYDPLVIDVFIAERSAIAGSEPEQRATRLEGLLKVPVTGGTDVPHTDTTIRLRPEVLSKAGALLEELATDIEATACVLYWRHPSLDHLQVVEARGPAAAKAAGAITQLGTKVTGWVAANGSAVVNTDLALEFPDWALMEPHLCVALPIRSGHDIVGILMTARVAKHPMCGQELKTLERIAMRFNELLLVDHDSGVESFPLRASVH